MGLMLPENRWKRLARLALVVVLLALATGCAAEPARGSPPPPNPTTTSTVVPADSVAAAGEPLTDAARPAEPTVKTEPTRTPAARLDTPTPVPTPAASPTPAPSATARPRTVALDPGHGGPEVGAAGGGLAEKDVNLKIALKLAGLLRERGIAVALTRDSDRAVSPEYTGAGYPGVGKDLQARVDVANAADADLFICIHNNGSADSGLSGTEVWYDQAREFGDQNLKLARLVQASLVKSIRALGYPVVDRGIKDDANFRTFQGRPYNIYVLGPGTGGRPHAPTAMPGVLGESMFLSNPGDVAMLRQDRTLDAIAAGYRDAVLAYFAK